MAKSSKLKLKIKNENYGEFNGLEISLSGFDKIPWRISPMGIAGGKYLLEQLKGRFGEFELVIARNKDSRIDSKKTPTQVIIRYDDVLKLRRDFRASYRLTGEKVVTKHLGMLFPEEFARESERDLPSDIREIDLSSDDIQKANQLFPFLEKYELDNTSALKRLLAGRKVLHYLRLEKVLNKFERKLKTVAKEQEWQEFFKENLLILNPGYMEIIEKPNISLEIKLPDFLLLNIEGYVDIYEIKIPETPLLQYDRGRNNYYWSSDVAKSISQVENYIDSIDNNRDSLIANIKEEYNLELKVIRPRGYIIAGHSRDLRESRKYDDFRLLNESLKSTEILPFDIFLERFKSFSKTLKEAA